MTKGPQEEIFEVTATVPITMGQIIEGLYNEDYDDLVQFVRQLDSRVGAWEFTKMLGSLIHEWFTDLNEQDETELELYRQDFHPVLVSLNNEWDGHIFEKNPEHPTRCHCGQSEVSNAHMHAFVASGLSTEMCACGQSRFHIHHRFQVTPV